MTKTYEIALKVQFENSKIFQKIAVFWDTYDKHITHMTEHITHMTHKTYSAEHMT